MMIVGLTGGIGSGKTTVAKMFHKLGVPIYMADLEAKILMNKSKAIKKEIIQVFGKEAYINSKLNTPFIADKIFNDKALLLKMNAIVHPKVAIHFKKWAAQQTTAYIIKEVAVLFENGGHLMCDAVITVTASREERIQRVIERDNSSAEKVKAIINNQWNDAKKIELSHFVIVNKDLPNTERQVKKIHHKLLNQ